MKKVLLSLVLMLGIALSSNAQVCGGTTLACSGGSSSTVEVTYTADIAGTYTACVGNSLCGSRGERVKVYVNNRLVYNRNVGAGAFSTSVQANEGDVIRVVATPGSVDQNIVCIWAGQIEACIGR